MTVKISRRGLGLSVRLPGKTFVEPEKLTLEKIFEGYNGEEYDRYDWGETDAPAGRELL